MLFNISLKRLIDMTRVLHFRSSDFLKDSHRKRHLALKKSQAALRKRETTISCLASGCLQLHIYWAWHSSDLFLCDLIVNYISHRFAI